jgi:hypothetical protein
MFSKLNPAGLTRGSVLAIFILLFGWLPAGAQEPSLEQRMTNLESRISRLEQLIIQMISGAPKEMPSMAPVPVPQGAPPPVTAPQVPVPQVAAPGSSVAPQGGPAVIIPVPSMGTSPSLTMPPEASGPGVSSATAPLTLPNVPSASPSIAGPSTTTPYGEPSPNVAPPPPTTAMAVPPANKGNWRAQANWRHHLKPGMKEDEVKALMGIPDKVENIWMMAKYWYYGGVNGGTITFTPKGVVKSWIEPPPNMLQY